MYYLSKEGLEERGRFIEDSIKKYGKKKVENWLKDKDKRHLINALCERVKRRAT